MKADSGSQDLLRGSPVRVRGIQMDLVHWAILEGKLHVAVRIGTTDVLLSMRPGEPVREAFLNEDGFVVKYDCHPGEVILDSRVQAGLRDLARRFLGRFGPDVRREARDRPPARPEVDPVLHLRPPPGYVVQASRKGPGCADIEFRSDDGHRCLRCSVSPRSPGSPGMMLWALSVVEAGDWDEDARSPFRQLLLDLLVTTQVAYGEGICWGEVEPISPLGGVPGPDPVDSDSESRGRHSRVRIDLGSTASDFQSALGMLATGPLESQVSIEVPSRCELRCSFCPVWVDPHSMPDYRAEPARWDALLQRVARLSAVLAERQRSGARFWVVLYGHDVVALPDAVELVRMIGSCQPRHVGIVGPGTRLADPEFAARLSSAFPGLSTVLTLLGPEPRLHDQIAGREGAFLELAAAVRNCRQTDIRVELNVVIVLENVRALRRILESEVGKGCRVNLMMFCTEFDFRRDLVVTNQPPVGLVRAALAELDGPSRDCVNSVIDVPWCALPEWARAVAWWPVHSLPDAPSSTPNACARCQMYRTPCPGPTNWYLQIFGETDLIPEVAVQ